MAAAVIPLAGIVGGAVDMSRLYLTKTRLQQACDAGALAGRKVMGGGQWSTNSYAARTAALQFFDANFKNGSYGTLNRSRSFSENAGKVTGTASAQVPMTVMKIFRQPTKTISVTCDAEMRLPNTDVMFVLDVTGSMDETIPGDTSKKIVGMRRSVKCFYEILARRDIDDEDCGSTPSGGVGGQVQVRFGFVPYSTNVNVGKLLPTSYFAQSWPYQTRVASYRTEAYPIENQTEEGYWEYYSESTATRTSKNAGDVSSLDDDDCEDFMDNRNIDGKFAKTPPSSGGPPPADVIESEFDNDGDASSTNRSWGGWGTGWVYSPGEWGWSGAPDTSGDNRSCRRWRVDRITEYSDTVMYKFSGFTYKQDHVDVRNFVAGQAVPIATGYDGYMPAPGDYDMVELGTSPGALRVSTSLSSWDGCIEERPTAKGTTNFDPIPATAYDLDIDLVPSAGNSNSLWGPIWNRLHFSRRNGSNATTAERTYTFDPDTTSNPDDESDNNRSSYSCAPEGRLLQEWNDAGTFKSYVNGLGPTSNTYHDIGLLWGARLMSPTGIFASQNATTPLGGAIERHLIFMTDGTAVADSMNQTAYGVPWYDRRQIESTSNSDLKTQIENRMSGLCKAVQNKNITLWVIYFGSPSGADRTRMESCATPGRFYVASNNATLISTFQQIAAQISNLRLTQ